MEAEAASVSFWANAATIAVAFLALVEIGRAILRDRSERAEAAARVSFLGFGLRRQLFSWLGTEPRLGGGFSEWIRISEKAETLGAHLDAAEHRVDEMSRLAPKLRSRRRRAVQEASVLFLAGTNRLNSYLSSRQVSGYNVFRDDQLRIDAEKDLIALAQVLEKEIVALDLLAYEKQLDEIREEHSVLNTMYPNSDMQRPGPTSPT